VPRGRSASRGNNASNVRGVSAANSTSSTKSKSRVTDGFGDSDYDVFVKEMVRLATQQNIPHQKLVVDITNIIRKCAKYTMQQMNDQFDQELADGEFLHQEEMDRLKQVHATSLDEYTRALDERDKTIKILDKNMEDIMNSTEKMMGTNSQLHHKLQEVTLERDESEKKIENLHNQMKALMYSSEEMIRDNSELADQLQEANEKIKKLEVQNYDLHQQIAKSQQDHSELMASVLRQTEDPKHVADDIRTIEESRDGPAEDHTMRFLDLDQHIIKRELPGSPASRDYVLRRSTTIPPRSGGSQPPGDDKSTRAAGPAAGARPALSKVRSLPASGRGSSVTQRPPWT
jgi:uncharacterized protein YoxC